MADNRQFTDHNEIGGVNVYLEDKKLAESPSQDEVASTDYILLKDTDGVPHKIVKDDFNEAVRDALGSILNNNTKGTAISKIAALGTSDYDLGSVSAADLASVLGVIRGTIAPNATYTPNGYGLLIISSRGKHTGKAVVISVGYTSNFVFNTDPDCSVELAGKGVKNTDSSSINYLFLGT